MSRFRARPYVKALFEVAGSASVAESFIPDLDRMAQAIDEVPELLKVMVSPQVSPETKAVILDRTMEVLDLSTTVRKFVRVVQGHYRLQHMDDIASGFREHVDRALGRVHARVEVAAAVDAAEREALTTALRKIVGSDVVAEFFETPSLLGGFRVQVGSKVFDGSLDGQLNQLGRGAL